MRFLIFIILMAQLVSCSKPPEPMIEIESPVSEKNSEITELERMSDPLENLGAGDPEIGREYFYGDNRGRCLRCHTLNGEGKPGTWPLDETGLRRDPEWLAIFIDNPRIKRAEVVRMPPFRGDAETSIAD